MTFTKVQINDNEIPTSIKKDIKNYVKASRKERIARAKITNFNSKHPEKQKSPVTKWASICSNLFIKIKTELSEALFPPIGTKVGYLKRTSDSCSEERFGVLESVDGYKATIKTRNGHRVERCLDEVYHDKAYAWSNVFLDIIRLA